MNFRGVYCRSVTNRSGAAKIGNFSLMQRHFSDILTLWPFVTWKLLTVF